VNRTPLYGAHTGHAAFITAVLNENTKKFLQQNTGNLGNLMKIPVQANVD
jgi:hypothetical protein